MWLDTKTYWLTDWLTDSKSQCDFYFDLQPIAAEKPPVKENSEGSWIIEGLQMLFICYNYSSWEYKNENGACPSELWR
jgi:hypothetical protein